MVLRRIFCNKLLFYVDIQFSFLGNIKEILAEVFIIFNIFLENV